MATTATQWFKTLSRVAYMWDRIDQNTVLVLFRGYKAAPYFDGTEALQALGGFVLTADFDQRSGCTCCEVREPKCLCP